MALSGAGLRISSGVFEELDLSNCCLHDITLDNCEIRVLIPPPQLPDGLVIRDCIIWKVQGISNPGILPEWIVGCEIEEYDQTPTNASILLDSDLRMGHRVLLTILRKLYLQRGAGRGENSLTRGLPSGSRELATRILESMKSMGFTDPVTLRGYRIWYPDRSRSGEVLEILNDYARSIHPLVEKAREMSEH